MLKYITVTFITIDYNKKNYLSQKVIIFTTMMYNTLFLTYAFP